MSTNDDSPAPPLAVPCPSITLGHFTQLQEAITSSQTRMERRSAEFRDEVRQGQEEAATKALKRTKFEKPYACRKKKTSSRPFSTAASTSPGAPTSATAITKACECLKKRLATVCRAAKVNKNSRTVGAWVRSGAGVYGG